MNTKNLLLSAALGLAAVSGAHAADKAVKSEKKTAKKASILPATKLVADTSASTVQWSATKKVGDGHTGKVPVQSGELEVIGKDVVGGEFVINIAGLTDEDLKDKETNDKLTGHLKSEDFFKADKFPTSTFKVKSAKALTGDKDGNTHEITGDLTIRDKTQTVSFPAKVEIADGGKKVTADAKATIDRTKFGLKYGSESFFKGLGDHVIHDKFDVLIHLVTK